MKKVLVFMLLLVIGLSAMAQQRIQLRSADKAECVSSDMTSLRASFSFSTIEAEDYQSEKGNFSWLSLPNTVIGGNEGDPQIPVINELIAVPFGATPRIEIRSYTTTDYSLADYDMKTLVPRQPSLRKDQHPEDVPFVMNEAAYQSSRGLRSEPQAFVEVVGTMRGVRLGKMTIEPVSYDPVNNTIRVFNDIEVTVSFDGANARATEQMLVETYSPYFNGIYDMLFNSRSIRSAYDDHPDLYNTPVKMLVVTTSNYVDCTPFQNWLAWKKQKGIDVDVQTVTSSTSAANVRSLIQSRYNANHPTFLVIVGDETAVTNYTTYSVSGLNYNPYVSDLQYASIDNDVYHDMFMSRMSVSSTTELGYLVDKILMYEKYTMPDPSYLNNVLLIAGADGTWAPRVGRPTINYAADNYFNTAHGFSNVYKYVSDTYTGCFNYLSSGVGFANYTAHGDIQEWYSPNFTNSDVNSLTNTNKYFWAMGNCCLTCNFGNSTYSPCYGEAMIRAQNKGAFGYIGSVPESYWYEDYYFGVGATSTMSQTPTMSQTTTGVYDFMFDDSQMNTLNAVPFAGNVAVTYAHANNYESSVSDEYYWRAYQCFGDGSVMPYHTQPAANNVTHANTISIGVTTFPVSADAGSYVAVTKNNVILGVAVVPSSGTVNVPISGLTAAGDVMIVVTRQQRQPYMTTIQAISANGPYISLDSYTPNTALVGQTTSLSLTLKNVGTAATSGTTTVTLSSSDATFSVNSKNFSALAANATTTLSGFSFSLNNGVTLGSPVTIHYTAVNGSNTWEGDFTIIPDQIFTVNVASNNNNYGTVSGGGEVHYGASCTVTATPVDGYMFTNWTQNGNVVSTDASYTFNVTGNVSLVANFAAGVMIGSGTNTNEYLPSYNYYNYTLSEQIYTSAELGGAGVITSIAFYNGGAEKTRNYDFYLKNTTKSTFTGATDWITVSASDKVFSGDVTMVAGDWTTITFSTPFVYDGTSNLVLVADDNTGSYTSSPHMSCRVFTATSQALYAYNDGTNYNPLSPPTSSSSNNAVLSSKNQIIITKEALSTEPVNITVSANPAEAATVTGGGEYTFGQACTVTATPTTGYTFTGWTENGTVVSDELSYSFTAISDRNLVANFIQAIEIGTATSTHNYLPTYNYYNYSLTEQIYTAAEIGVAGTINSIAFYNEGTEKTRTLDFYLKNTTKTSFSSTTDWITVAASDKVFSGSVTMAANAWTYINFTTPFEYDGTSNLVLVTDDNSGAYTSSPHMACSVFNAEGNQSIYYYDDDTNFNPLAPPTSAGTSTKNNVLSVKNHILLGITISGNPRYTIAATANPTEGGTVSGNGTFEEGETCTLTATANTGYNFTNWTKNGVQVSTEATYSFTVTAAGAYVANFEAIPQYTITILPDDVEKGTVAFGNRSNREELVYDFEDGTSQGWTTFQGNTTSPHSWMHITDYTYAYNYSTMSSGHGYNESDGYMYSESYITGASSGNGTIVTPDNYLVSPQVRLGGSITFHAGGQNVSYCEEHFSLMVSTTGNTEANDFTTLQTWTFTPTVSSGNEWQEFTVDLSAYSGMGYVAIRHFDCSDQWFLCIDDVTITEPEVDDGSVSRTFYEGESCTVVATPSEDYYFAEWTENGTSASSNANYTFTVTGDRELVANFSLTPACEVVLDAVESFETYTESTELWTGAFPGCWTIAHNYTTHASDSVAVIYRSFKTHGYYSLRLNYRGIVAMPALALPADVDINHVKLNMNVRQSQKYYSLQVGVMTDLDDESTFVPVALCDNPTKDKLPFECTFADYVVPENYDGPFYIAFKNIGVAATDPYSVNYLDEVVVSTYEDEEIPACAITQLEYKEYFDDFTVADDGRKVPECWTLPEEFNNIPTNNKPQLYNSFAQTGYYSLKMRDLCVYAMPKYAVTSTPITNVKMTFWLRQAKKSYQLEVGVMTNANDASTFIPVQTIDNETTGKEEVTVLFNTYTGPTDGDLYIAFRNKGNTSAWTYSYNYIDDITLVDVNARGGDKIAETADGEVFDTDRYMESIAVYPNPTTGVLHIDAVDVQKVECYNQMGQLVGVYDHADELNISELSNGVYMLRITVPQGVTMRKVVKK